MVIGGIEVWMYGGMALTPSPVWKGWEGGWFWKSGGIEVLCLLSSSEARGLSLSFSKSWISSLRVKMTEKKLKMTKWTIIQHLITETINVYNSVQ